MGVVSALGSVKSLWESLLAGRSGIQPITTVPTEHTPVKIAAEVRDFDVSGYIDHKEARRMGRASQFAVSAAYQAIEDAGLSPQDIEDKSERVGVVVGTTLGSHEMSTNSTFDFRTTWRKPNPLALINSLPNMPSHYISRFLRALGPLNTPSTACAAGTQSVGEASTLIREGRADVVLTGGVEAILQDYTIAGFSAMTALASEYNDDPTRASRPFDKNRSGFVMGEGAGILVIESLAHAIKRGARIYAEILGHASSSDGYHIAALDPTASGATRSIKWALDNAAVNGEDVGYINAHGTSTPQNDAMETTAIKRVIGEAAYNIPVSSTKSMIGHAFGAAGAIEAVVSALSLFYQRIHPTINYETPDPECDLDYVPNEARDVQDLRYVLSNSFGLGGQNASLVLGRV
ncbi:MAG: beta-ketoacyl-[acyl-carrier-protein] synthase II [Anaerolineae bacterium]|jgi:beta-ketoacyl-acyl-carrier-protein synthase II|nr:beta-ketoacyl-[acyl-carrier-protein] synthase II [Anaerolineae bacterium]